jgi:hypothetical protein
MIKLNSMNFRRFNKNKKYLKTIENWNILKNQKDGQKNSLENNKKSNNRKLKKLTYFS